MATIKFFVSAVLALCSLWVQAETTIYEDGKGSIRLGVPQAFKDSGIKIEDDITITAQQFAQLKKGEAIALKPQVMRQSWGAYYLFIETTKISMEQLVLVGTTIKKVRKVTDEKTESFNPFFHLALLYIVFMLVLYRMYGMKPASTMTESATGWAIGLVAFVAFSACVGIVIVVSMTVSTPTITAGVTVATSISAAVAIVVGARDKDFVFAGIAAMVVASVCMFFLI